MPGTRLGRLFVGILLILFGILGFLPILGFWMIPLGLVVLSVDFPVLRRGRRRATIAIGRWVQRIAPDFWAKYIAPAGNGTTRDDKDRKQR